MSVFFLFIYFQVYYRNLYFFARSPQMLNFELEPLLRDVPVSMNVLLNGPIVANGRRLVIMLARRPS